MEHFYYWWNFIKDIATSPLVAAIVGVLITVWLGLKIFLTQQRISRIQKIYYEESLLNQLNHFDDTIKKTNQNYAFFNNAINSILNDIKINKIDLSTVITLNEIATQITIPEKHESFRGEVLIILFKKYGYLILQWLSKYDTDHIEFNLFIRECILRMAQHLKLNPRISEEAIKKQNTEIKNLYDLRNRHFALPYLFNKLVSRISIMDFKSREDIIKRIANDHEISNNLKKTDEAFKILFGYFKLEENTYLSYLISEKGYRFKIRIDNKVTIERIKHDLPDLKQMIIIKNDYCLSGSNVIVDGIPKNYPNIQLGMANFCAFDEKPQFYPEVESFDDPFKQAQPG